MGSGKSESFCCCILSTDVRYRLCFCKKKIKWSGPYLQRFAEVTQTWKCYRKIQEDIREDILSEQDIFFFNVSNRLSKDAVIVICNIKRRSQILIRSEDFSREKAQFKWKWKRNIFLLIPSDILFSKIFGFCAHIQESESLKSWMLVSFLGMKSM